jgi:hypothetical protein
LSFINLNLSDLGRISANLTGLIDLNSVDLNLGPISIFLRSNLAWTRLLWLAFGLDPLELAWTRLYWLAFGLDPLELAWTRLYWLAFGLDPLELAWNFGLNVDPD